MRLGHLIQAALFMTGASLGLAKVTLDQEINEAYALISPQAGIEGKLVIVDTGDTSARARGEIIISRSELNLLLQEVPGKQRRHVIMLVVAHELAHLLQYREYNITPAFQTDAWRKTFEAQADLLAGLWVGRTIYTFKSLLNQGRNGEAAAIATATKVFFGAGRERFALGSHPSQAARRMAVGIGMGAAEAEACREFARNKYGLNEAWQSQLRSVNMRLTSSFPFHAGHSFVTFDVPWTLKAARSLTHADPAAARFLTAHVEENSYDTNPQHADAKHWVVLQNTGSRPLRIYWQVSLVYTLRKDPGNVLLWRHGELDSFNRELELAPGEAERLIVNYNWVRIADDLIPRNEQKNWMPALKYPPHDEAPWCVTFADEPELPPGPTTLEIATTYAGGPATTLRSSLVDLYGAAIENAPESHFITPEYSYLENEPYSRMDIGFPAAEVIAVRKSPGRYVFVVKREFRAGLNEAKTCLKEWNLALDNLRPGLKRTEPLDQDDTSWVDQAHSLKVTTRIRSAMAKNATTLKPETHHTLELTFIPNSPP